MKPVRQFLLARALHAGIYLIWSLLVTGILWLAFLALGDYAAANLVQGMTAGLAICLFLDFAFLMVCLAYGELKSD